MIAKKEIPKAASAFNAYNKKLGFNDPTHEKYIGTIFSRQQTGFVISLESSHQRKLRSDFLDQIEPPETLSNCRKDDFDPSIRYGRDDKLFVKRECLDRLSSETRYSEEELNNLKTVYVSYAQEKRGLTLDSFTQLYGILTNIDNHPFIREIFLFFDKNNDGLVDFNEFIVGLDIIERGNFDEKSQYCY